jgi:hypothetical protein
MESLFTKTPTEWTTDEQKSVTDIYKMLVDMADKVSQRRQSANNFFLSVNTALIGASAYISSVSQQSPARVLAIAAAGTLVSAVWVRNIQSYKDLNSGKFAVINEIEKQLPIAPYTAEWEYLERGQKRNRYRQFHAVEILVPLVFVAVHALQFAWNIPWSSIASAAAWLLRPVT